MENGFKRFLSLALAIVMVLSNVPVQAFATDGIETVCTEHQYNITYNTATCTAPGVTYQECSVCHVTTEQIAVSALGHDFGDNAEVCAVCKEPNPDYVAPHEHVWGEPVVVEATCDAAGSSTRTCSAEGCDVVTETTTIDALGHDYVEGICSRCRAEEPQPEVQPEAQPQPETSKGPLMTSTGPSSDTTEYKTETYTIYLDPQGKNYSSVSAWGPYCSACRQQGSNVEAVLENGVWKAVLNQQHLSGCVGAEGSVFFYDESTNLIVAEVLADGETYYAVFKPDGCIDTEAELQYALNNGGEVVLGGNINTNAQLVVPANVSVTLDLKGFKLFGSWCEHHYDYVISNSGTLTVKDSNGSGQIAGTTEFGSSLITNNGILKIEGGNFECGSKGLTNNGTATITGGTFNKGGVEGGTLAIEAGTFNVNVSDATITGGTFNRSVSNSTITGGTFADDVTAQVSEGYACAKDENGKYVVSEVKAPVAMIGDVEYTSLEEAVKATQGLSQGKVYITLLEDVTLTETLVFDAFYYEYDSTVELQLNGHTITAPEGVSPAIYVKRGHIRIPSGDEAGTINAHGVAVQVGTPYNKDVSPEDARFAMHYGNTVTSETEDAIVVHHGKLNLPWSADKGSTVTTKGEGKSAIRTYAGYSNIDVNLELAKLTSENGTAVYHEAGKLRLYWNCDVSGENALYIESGEVSFNLAGSYTGTDGAALVLNKKGDLTIDVIEERSQWGHRYPSFTGTDAAIESTGETVAPFIDCGKYAPVGTVNAWMLSDYQADANGLVSIKPYVATVNGTSYTSLEAAIEAANGGTVTLAPASGSVVECSGLTISEDVTIDFNDKTLSFGPNSTGVKIAEDATVTLKNGSIQVSSYAAIPTLVDNAGNLTLDDLKIGCTSDGATTVAMLLNSGTTTIKNNSQIKAYTYTANTNADKNATGIKITAGSVTIDDSNGNGSFTKTIALEGGSLSIASGHFDEAARTVVESALPEGKIMNSDGNVVNRPIAAKINGAQGYYSLQAAFDAAQDGDVITVFNYTGEGTSGIINNFAESVVLDAEKSITLNLTNGHMNNWITAAESFEGTLFTIKKGTLTVNMNRNTGGTSITGTGAVFCVEGGKLVVNGRGSLSSRNDAAIRVSGGEVQLNNDITVTHYSTNPVIVATGNGNVTISGQNGMALSSGAAAIEWNSTGKLTIENPGKISGKPAIDVKQGTVEIRDAALKGDGDSSALVLAEGVTAAISGGSYQTANANTATIAVNGQTGFITGGAFDKVVAEELLGEEYICINQSDKQYLVQKACVVTYKDGDTTVHTEKVVVDTVTTAFVPANKDHYTFDGWFEKDATTAFDFTASITKNVTLYAKYTPVNYTVTFDSNGGSAVEPVTAAYGQSVGNFVTPTRDGYVFKGWLDANENEVKSLTIAGNTTLTAKWEEKVMAAEVNGEQYETLAEAIAIGGEVKVLTDIVLTEGLTIARGNTVILNLNGHTISQSKECTASYEMINNLGKLTITGNGKLSFTDTGAGDPNFGWGSYTIRNEGTLVVENGTIEHLGAQASHCIQAIFQYAGSTTIKGGTISTPNYRSIRLWHGTMTIDGGEMVGRIWVQPMGGEAATLTINGGTITPKQGDANAVYVSGGNTVNMTINGGTFNGAIADANNQLNAAITNGTFSNDVSKYVADGFKCVQNANGTYGIAEKDPVAQIVGGEKYKSLQEAVNAAENGQTITLLDNIEQADGVLISSKNLTIDLNGKTFTVTEGANTNNRNIKITGTSVVTVKNGTLIAEGEMTSGAYGTIRTEGTAKVTLDGLKLYSYRDGGLNVKACNNTNVVMNNVEIYAQYGGGVEAQGSTVEMTNVTIEQKGVYDANGIWYAAAIGIHSGGKVTINSGSYSAQTISGETTANWGNWIVYLMNSGGSLEINGGTFTGVVAENETNDDYAYGLICADTKAVVNINGGTFNSNGAILDMRNNTGATPNPEATLKGGTFSADPRISGLYSSNLIKMAEGYTVKEESGKFVVVEMPNVAQIGDKLYKSLQKAVEVGGEIKLLADVTENVQISENANIVLDLNGKTVNGYFAPFKGNVTVKNGSIKNTDKNVSAIEINAGELTLNDVNVESERHALRIDGAVAATITDGTYKVIGTNKGTYHALNVSGAANVTISGGTFTGPKGTSADSGAAVNVKSGATVTINGGNFSGGKNNTLANGGTLTITGGTFDQKPDKYVAAGYEAVKVEGGYKVRKAATGTLKIAYVEEKNGRTRVYGDITNEYANESVVAKLYSGENLIATTTLTNPAYLANGTLSLNIVLNGEASSSWNTVIKAGHPVAHMVPDRVVLYLDGNEKCSAEVTLNRPDNMGTPYVWGALTGVKASPAMIGDYGYATLAEAFAAVKDGETIKLHEDMVINGETFTIADGKSITLDMNGKKITATDNKGNKTSYELFYIYGGLTVIGNGTIELTSTSNDTAFAKSSTIFHNRGGNLTVENGTFKHLGGTAWLMLLTTTPTPTVTLPPTSRAVL